MNVPAHIQQRIVQILKDGCARATSFYKREFPMPTITYKIGGGRVAGTATFRTWTVNFNPGILMQNVEEFLNDTVLHELGHLVCDKVYPEAHQAGIRMQGFRFKREKRDLHGPRWVEAARACGHPNPTRCHNMDTTGLKKGTASRVQYKYACPCGCKKVYTVSEKIHQQLVRNPDSRFHRRGYRLVLQGSTAPVVTAAKVLENVTAVKPQDQQGSKIEQCWAIYKRNIGSSRAAIIQTMVSVANCTPAGAATYYATCKKRYESGVL